MLIFVAIFLHSVSKMYNNPDMFCYVCGELTVRSKKCSLMPLVKNSIKYTLAENSGTQTSFGSPISVAVHV